MRRKSRMAFVTLVRKARVFSERGWPAAACSAPLAAGAPSAGEAAARAALGRILSDEHRVDAGLRRAMAGKDLDAQSLLLLQCDVMRYSQEVDLASRLVDRVAGDIKQIMQTQV